MSKGKRGNWSVQELARLETLYPRCPEQRVAELLGRSVDSVRRRARDLFTARRPPGAAWTAADDHGLRLAYGAHPAATIALILGRPESEVRRRIEALRGARRSGRWTARETALLKQLYGTRADEDLEVCLSRSREDIERAAQQLCLCKDKRFVAARHGDDGVNRVTMPRWSDAEVRRLVDLYPDCTNLDIARTLGRSVASVANKANQLRLKKSPALLERMGRHNVAVRYRR